MNERIKELKQQARDFYLLQEDLDCSTKELHELVEQKFAELIVRQCVKSTLSRHDTAIDNEWHLDETFHMIVDTIVEDLDMQHIFRSEE